MPVPIEHIIHDDSINEIIFYDDDRAVVDTYIKIIESLLIETINDTDRSKILVLLNLTYAKSIPPFSYIVQKGRIMLQTYVKNRHDIRLRVAVVVRKDDLTTVSLLQVFSQLLPIDAKLQSFDADSHNDAMTWLLTIN